MRPSRLYFVDGPTQRLVRTASELHEGDTLVLEDDPYFVIGVQSDEPNQGVDKVTVVGRESPYGRNLQTIRCTCSAA